MQGRNRLQSSLEINDQARVEMNLLQIQHQYDTIAADNKRLSAATSVEAVKLSMLLTIVSIEF